MSKDESITWTLDNRSQCPFNNWKVFHCDLSRLKQAVGKNDRHTQTLGQAGSCKRFQIQVYV